MIFKNKIQQMALSFFLSIGVAATPISPLSADVTINKFRGAWNDTTKYKPGNIVTFNGAVYLALVKNLNIEPDTDSSQWFTLAPNHDAANTSVNTLSSQVNKLSDDVAYLQGHPAPTPIALTYQNQFINAQVTAVSLIRGKYNGTYTDDVTTSFTITNKTSLDIYVLAKSSSFYITTNQGGACEQRSPSGLDASPGNNSTGRLDSKNFAKLAPGSSLSLTLKCTVDYPPSSDTLPTSVNFGGVFYYFDEANPNASFSVAFTGVAPN
ncbi:MULTISPECIES: putative carbohydrate binding protein [Methylomicrobium]|uniref:Putative carbohydrate binding protein n=1 Tax=Methylomicrobium album BG8 TaxID=686340 RepID=H8GL67_METAL|nr:MULTISPECIES: putative carbohydrate binding protein [Methylomicrobium]EIC28066.1 putative carbohydrate binding protein [Methylomicrobium album BG8]